MFIFSVNLGLFEIVCCSFRPDLLLVNGPGSCIPVVFAAALFDMIRLRDTIIIYEESICRVESLSLSGESPRLLLYTTVGSRIANLFFLSKHGKWCNGLFSRIVDDDSKGVDETSHSF